MAFVKHTTIDENIGISSPSLWAKGLKAANFSLLCRDGRRSVIDNFYDCNWAQVTSHKVSRDLSVSDKLNIRYSFSTIAYLSW